MSHGAMVIKAPPSSRSSSETKEDRPSDRQYQSTMCALSLSSLLALVVSIPDRKNATLLCYASLMQHQKPSDAQTMSKCKLKNLLIRKRWKKLKPLNHEQIPRAEKVCYIRYILTCHIGFSIKGRMRSDLDSRFVLRCGTFSLMNDVLGMNLVFNCHKSSESVHIV